MFVIRLTIFLLLITINITSLVFAGEKIGNLVFNAMKEIQETHRTFLSDVKQIRMDRGTAISEREAVKNKYEKAKEGTLDKKEFHARYSYSQAKVFRALYDEAKLTRKIAGKQLMILNRLKDSITSEKTGINAKVATSVVNASKPFLENGKSLLSSLSKYRDKITDPVINSKLNAAYDTARMLSRYVKHIENGRTSKYASQQVLQQKVTELIEQLNALYVQTDIFMAMVRDKSTLLKIITELAASDAAISILVEGRRTIDQLSDSIMSPLMNELIGSDQNLDTLFAGVFENHQGSFKPAGSQKWTNLNF